MRCRPLFSLVSLVAILSVAHGQTEPASNESRVIGVTDVRHLSTVIGIKAKVNGVECTLLLDTGSYEFRITKAFARRAGLIPESETASTSVRGSAVRLEIGAFGTDLQQFLIDDRLPFVGDPSKKELDGLIGLNMLQDHAIGLDLISNKFAIWSGGNVPDEEAKRWFNQSPGVDEGGNLVWLNPGEKSNPLKQASTPQSFPLFGDRGKGDWYRIRTEVDGQAYQFVLDTGSSWSMIAPALAAKTTLEKIGPISAKTFYSNSILTATVAKQVMFGPVMHLDHLLAIGAKDEGYDGVMGLSSLENSKLFLDFSARRGMIYRHHEFVPPQENAPLKTVGLDWIMLADSRLMAIVANKSPAYLAGLRTGDVLVTFNGRKGDDLARMVKDGAEPAEGAAAWMIVIAQPEYRLELKRPSGETKSVVIKRPSS